MDIYKSQRKLLKQMVKQTKASADNVFLITEFVPDSNNFDFKQLRKANYIALTYKEFNRATGTGIHDYFFVTQPGLKYFDMVHEKNMNFLKENVITPMFVSAATTCLIWFIGWLVGLLH